MTVLVGEQLPPYSEGVPPYVVGSRWALAHIYDADYTQRHSPGTVVEVVAVDGPAWEDIAPSPEDFSYLVHPVGDEEDVFTLWIEEMAPCGSLSS